jgi:LacI family transcriptional regulator
MGESAGMDEEHEKLRAPTIRDVARAANVSPAAVSRYLSNQLQLPELTANRIDSAIKSLNYVPNAIARRMSLNSSETIGFITSDIVNSFFASIASAAEEAASQAGYSLTIFNSRNDIDRELQFLARVDDRQVDGLLFLTNHADDGRLRSKINASRCIVLLDEDVPGAIAPRLFAENQKGADLATAHLIKHGHRRIAYVGGPRGLLSGEERLQGFLLAHANASLSTADCLIHSGSYDERAAYEVLLHLWELDDPPTAIFAAGDVLALGIMRAARDLGLRIPRDFSLVSFDDIPHASLFDPPLTTVRQSSYDFGWQGVRLLLDLMNGDAIPPDPPRLPVTLTVRESVGPPPRPESRKGPSGRPRGARRAKLPKTAGA